MQITSSVALLCTQYAVISLAAPPPSSDPISSSTQSPNQSSLAVSAAATSSSPYYGYFRTVVGSIDAELPPFLTKYLLPPPIAPQKPKIDPLPPSAALATKNLNATHNIPNITASLPSAPTVAPIDIADYPLNSPHRTFNYTVPHTLTNLTLHLANPGQVPPIDPSSYAKTLLSLKRSLQAEINSTGDRWLPSSEDPYGWDIGLGCWVEFWSNPEKGVDPDPAHNGRMEKQHLTLGVLHAVAEGLLQRLVYKGLYEFVYVEVFDSAWGQVGMGFVSPYQGRGNGTDGIGSVLATLRIEGKR